MSGKTLALWIVLPFLLLSALGLWLTQRRSASPVFPPAPPPPAALPSAAPAARPPAHAAATPAATAVPVQEPGEDPLTPGSEDEARVEAPPGADAGPPGALDVAALRAAVQAVRPLLRQCFLDVTERYPGPQSVRLRFTLEGQGTAGRMRNAEVDQTSIQDPFLLACFVDALEDAQFPAPRGGAVTVSYPFRFQAARAGPDAG